MADQKSVYRVAAIVFAVLVAIIATIVILRLRGQGGPAEEVTPTAVVAEPTPVATPGPSLQERLSARLAGVTLRTSDAVVRELVAELSSHPKLAAWAVNEDLIRRFAAAVDNIAAGKSPRAHLEFLTPSGSYRAVRRGDSLRVDPRSYRRYDLPAEVFASIDASDAVTLYRELKPLIAEAYREIAPPGRDFDDTLSKAIAQLLAVPVLAADVELREKVVTYTYADDKLESLTDAQRHFLRMGPENVRRVQAKLREIQTALGSPQVG